MIRKGVKRFSETDHAQNKQPECDYRALGGFAARENPIRHPAKFRIQAHGGFPVNVCP
jgi:hypothetical protein